MKKFISFLLLFLVVFSFSLTTNSSRCYASSISRSISAPPLSRSSVAAPSGSYSFTRTTTPSSPAFYNASALEYIKIKSITVYISGYFQLYFDTTGYMPSINETSYYNFLGINYSVHSYREGTIATDTTYRSDFTINGTSSNLSYNDFFTDSVLYLTGDSFYNLYEQYPNASCKTRLILNSFQISITLDVSNQYYYVPSYYMNYQFGVGTEDIYIQSAFKHPIFSFRFSDSNELYFNSQDFSGGYNNNYGVLFTNLGDYSNSYITDIMFFGATIDTGFTSGTLGSYSGFADYGFRLFFRPTGFSPYNTAGQNSLTGANTPRSNSYYKNCEWYDIFGHIYNLIIYLVFDAPLISDIFTLLNTSLQFIVNIFSTATNLFSNQYIFAMFIGFLVLAFVLRLLL